MSRRKPYELSPGKGPSMWRTLEDKNTDPAELQKMAEEEKPGGFVTDLLSPKTLVSRRSFVQGSSIAALAAGLQGCVRRPENEIFPYSKAPEHLIPGIASHFASVTARGRDSLGVVLTSHDGRPTKVEGNPEHSRSFGGTDVRAQAYVWDLYDPDRSQSPARRRGNALANATDADFDDMLAGLVSKHEKDQGEGLRFLAPISNSPTFRRMRDKVIRKLPKARFHTYSPIDDDNIREGAKIALGSPVYPVYDFARAMGTVSLGADFLGSEMGAVANGRRFVYPRGITSPSAAMSRVYVVESNFTITGGMADARLRLPLGEVERFTRLLVAELSGRGIGDLVPLADLLGKIDGALDIEGVDINFLSAVADDLVANRGQSLVVPGAGQSPRVHALAHAINYALGNANKTFAVGPIIDAGDEPSRKSIAALASEIDSVQSLVMLGGNPVYDAPADVEFAKLLGRKGLTSVHVASHRNETSELSSWHAPLAHELEAWGDQQALNGVVAIQQPLIAPLYGGRNPIDILAVFAGEKATAHELVRETQKQALDGMTTSFLMVGFSPNSTSQDALWRGALHSGVFVPPQRGDAKVLDTPIADALVSASAKRAPVSRDNFEINFEPDSALYDGTHANNLWALELPSPMTKLVWDNAALISPATAKALGVKNTQMIRLTKGEAKVELPVWIVPGHADFCITLSLGWGRTAAGRYGNGKGFDVNPLRNSDGMDFTTGVKVEALTGRYNLVQTQTHDRMEGRPIAIDATLDEYKAEPDFASYRAVDPVNTPPLWKQQDYSEGHKWGMVIDLNGCTGCNACVVACQAENNIPAVGKFEVERGREMHWLRIDRYFVGDDEGEPEVAVQPVTCQQCEEAPCENVCPVNATTHTPEGLNDMAYNRCVGTRYCANNCPYKVRRYNYLDWHGHMDDKFAWFEDFPESRKLQFNPNVTVRMRGVMEKCTYCVQRIQEGKIAAKRDGRQLKDGDIMSACQQACPTQAIAFGDLNDPKSRVARWANVNRNYKLLPEVGTRPRTSFLARIRNPNPKLKGNG
ncbi:MAG: 4Fe-4S dicluster domain-containing protein [Myxococcales bacterium]|nr:MAG: 4Fe-4S dicluster domain-containing protein [Myxococcales bacterium]